jgi:hypothetical protein
MKVSGQLHAPAALLPGKEPFALGTPYRRSWRCEVEKNLLSLPINEPRLLGRSTNSLISVLTEQTAK